MLDFNDDLIKVVMLAAFGFQSKEEIFEEVYLKALLDSFERIPKDLKTEGTNQGCTLALSDFCG